MSKETTEEKWQYVYNIQNTVTVFYNCQNIQQVMYIN